MPAPLSLRLIDRRALAPGVLQLGFAQAQDAPLPVFKPGQFIQLFFPDAQGQMLRRSYSIANAPSPDGITQRWELAVRLLEGGAGSTFLQHLAEGSMLAAAGPFGRFHLMPGDAPRRFLLLATGTGIAPFRAMLPGLRVYCEAGTPVQLLCGARMQEELVYRDDFLALARERPTFGYHGCLSRQPPAPDAPDLVSGRVQDMLAALGPGPGDLAFLCGNPAMVDDCTTLLSQAGLALRAIRRERYVASG